MSKITDRLEKIMVASFGIALLDVLVGILFLLYTNFSNTISLVIVGALFLVHGFFYLIRYIYDGLGKKVFGVDIIFGVASIILGVFTLINAFAGLGIQLLLLFGISLIIFGLENACFGINFMKRKEETYVLVIFISLLVIIMGIVAIVNPFRTFLLATRLLSYFLMATGLFECMYSNLFKKRAKAILDLYK